MSPEAARIVRMLRRLGNDAQCAAHMEPDEMERHANTACALWAAADWIKDGKHLDSRGDEPDVEAGVAVPLAKGGAR
jgi:hypothetical protein